MSFIIQGLESAGQGITSFFGGVGNTISQGIGGFAQGISQMIQGIISGIEQIVGDIKKFFGEVAKKASEFASKVTSTFGSIESAIGTGVTDVENFAHNLPTYIGEALHWLYQEIENGLTDVKNFVLGGVSDFVEKIVGFGDVVKQIMTYSLSYIRYEASYALYYIASHWRNLVGGFMFGLFFNEVRKMGTKSFDGGISRFMGRLLFTGTKYAFMDITLTSLFSLYVLGGKLTKPIPPSIPGITGLKLL